MTVKFDTRKSVDNESRRKILRYLAMGALAGAVLSDFPAPPKRVFASAPADVTVTSDYIAFPTLSNLVASTGNFAFETDAGGVIVNPVYAQDNTNIRVLRPEQAVSYFIFMDATDGNAIKAKNGLTGNIDYSNTDASTVIQSAINALTNGGLIHLAANTTFNLQEPISITGGNNGANLSTWILEGEGRSTVLTTAMSSSTNAIEISGETRVVLRDFYINMPGNSTGRAIFGNSTANNYSCFRESLIENVDIDGGAPDNIVYLINPFYSKLSRMRISGGPANALLRIEEGNGSASNTTKFFGNCEFIHLFLNIDQHGTSGVYGLQLTTTNTGMMGLNHFTSLYVNNASGLPSGSHAIHLDGGSKFNKFDYVDLEGFDISIYLNGTGYGQNASVYNNTFLGGYVEGRSYNTYATIYTRGNLFKALQFGGTTGGIYDAGQGYGSGAGPNVYEDLGTGGPIPLTIVNRVIMRGALGAGKFATNCDAAKVGDGGTISHKLATTPKWVTVTGTVPAQTISVTALNSTTFTVAIKTDTGAAGTSQTVYWQAGIQ